jgi:hypothetical protein
MRLDDGTIIPGLAFSCRAQPDCEVRIDPREHSGYKWATLDDLAEMEFVDPKMKQMIIRLLISQSRSW